MAVVYVGADLKLQRTVAIKVMDPRLSLMPGMAERFLQEARIAARLQHPSVIVVHDVQQEEELIFFVMSLIEGGAVDELCRRPEPIGIDETRWILLHACSALAYAHSEGIVHRDVKPANILLNLKGDVVLTDFGIAKAVDGGGLTKSGTQIGTPVYMSPEQFSDRPVGPASDQYALGVTAYEMLTGRPPFTGELYALIAAHGTKAPVPIRQLRPDCPAYLANAVMRMLEKEPENRWPSLDDLHEVFGANLPNDGGSARRQLASTARDMHRQRSAAVQALTARPPLSPVPTNSGRVSAAKPRSSDLLVTISPPGATIFVGGALDFAATVSAEAGDVVDGATVGWQTSDPAVMVVRADGRVTGTGAGMAIVRATVAGGFAEATVRVETAPIARLTVSTPSLTMRVGDVVRPTVSALDVTGSSRTDVSLSWLSLTPEVATLDAPGSIRGVHPGLASIEVSAGNIRRSIEITVVRRPISQLRLHADRRSLELGATVTLHAAAFDDLGGAVQATALRWRSSAPSIIHVDSAGTAMAIGPGRARIFVETDETSDAIELEAVESPIDTIELAIGQSELEVGDEASLFLRVKDATGGARSTSGVLVFSTEPAVVSVDPVRMTVRALALGDAQLVAQADRTDGPPISTVALVAVRAPVVVRVEVAPTSLELDVGAMAALSVRCLDRRGREVVPERLDWRSEAAELASVDGGGVVRAVAGGSVIVRAIVLTWRGSVVEGLVAVRVRPAATAIYSSGVTPPSALDSAANSFSVSPAVPRSASPSTPPIGSRTGEQRKRAREARAEVTPLSATQVVPSDRSSPLADVSAASLGPVASGSVPVDRDVPAPFVSNSAASTMPMPGFSPTGVSTTSAAPARGVPRGAMAGAAVVLLIAAAGWYGLSSSSDESKTSDTNPTPAETGSATTAARTAEPASTAAETSATSASPPPSAPAVEPRSNSSADPIGKPTNSRVAPPTSVASTRTPPSIGSAATPTNAPARSLPRPLPGSRTPASSLPPLTPADRPRPGAGAGAPASSSAAVSSSVAAGEAARRDSLAANRTAAREAESRSAEPLSSDDVRQAAEAIVQRIRRGGERSGELGAFFKDGDKHTVELVGTPSLQSLDGARARSQFQIRVFRVTPGGVPQTRSAQVTIEVARKDGAVSVSSISVGELVRAR